MKASELLSGTRVWKDELPYLGVRYRFLKVLVTGALGSIGSVLVKTLEEHGALVDSIDSDENRVSENPKCRLGDARHANLETYRFVFHCAAYKHVVLGEKYPGAFIRNNVDVVQDMLGRLPTKTRFVLISTDKAAGDSFMGKTKREAEAKVSSARQTAVRLCNVVGSRGSCIWRWRNDSDIKVADGDVRRFWIQPEDAVQAILRAGTMLPGVYTVWDPPEIPLRDLAECFDKIPEPMPLRPGETEREVLYNSKWEKPIFTEVDYLRRIEKA